jgi:predicted AlkP superfamily phosphohydrolase/phosphomutase
MKKLLAIGLDAADPELIEKWTDDGTLPNLKRMRAAGAYGRLATPVYWLAGSPWFTFYTSQNPARHGAFNFLGWRADKMTMERVAKDWLPVEPFWRRWDSNSLRGLVLDMPLVYAPEPFNGVELSNWATHDWLGPTAAYPVELLDWVKLNFTSSIRQDERFGTLRKKEFFDVRDEMVSNAHKMKTLAVALMKKETWDMALIGFSALHRGGHKLWNLANVSEEISAAEKPEMLDALRQVYIACDHAVGELVAAAGQDANVMIFSLHGMRDNVCRVDILPEMLRRVLKGENPDNLPAPKKGLLKQMRELVPIKLRQRVKTMLPAKFQDKLTSFWRLGHLNWHETSAFSMFADLQGLIRINLKGREAQGIVEPGVEYELLCEKIARELKTFVDADTGQPLIREIVRSSQIFHGENSDMLPDLLVNWSDTPANQLRAAVSPMYGTIAWPAPGQNTEGRSGNHRPEGMLIACGENMKAGTIIRDAHIMDIAPTILSLLGQPIPVEMEGCPLKEIVQ